MKAYVFPGQASQFEGMGKDLYEASDVAKSLFEQANDILGFRITDVMFEGSATELQQTKITQPAVFLHSIVKVRMAGEAFQPEAVAGHSLGEFSALVASDTLSFKDGLELVAQRAAAMQKACEATEGTMAAIIGLEDEVIERICAEIKDVVIPANYNCPGQLVISGSLTGVNEAIDRLKEAGARRTILLPVGGAFHSPLMQPAKDELQSAIESTIFTDPRCPIYQNVNGRAERNAEIVQQNLIAQLTSPVRWTQSIRQMIADGMTEIIEVGGTGRTLQGFVKKINRRFPTSSL